MGFIQSSEKWKHLKGAKCGNVVHTQQGGDSPTRPPEEGVQSLYQLSFRQAFTSLREKKRSFLRNQEASVGKGPRCSPGAQVPD